MALDNLLYAPEPEYPTLAKLTDVEGNVELGVLVSRQGTVQSTQVMEGNGLLRAAAEAAVRQWRFRPFLLNGEPAAIRTTVLVRVQPR